MEIEEKRIEQYISHVTELLYSEVLHVRALQEWEGGTGVVITNNEETYNDSEKLYVKINGSTITVSKGSNYDSDEEEIRLEDPKSIERFWKILNHRVMKMIDEMSAQTMKDLQEHSEKTHELMNEQFKLLSAKTHIIAKMVTNPVIVELDKFEFPIEEPVKNYTDDDVPF